MKRASTDENNSLDYDKPRKLPKYIQSLPITPITKYAREFPYFRQPTEFGCFSLDGKRTYHDDDSQLKYFDPPETNFHLDYNLREGYEKCIEKDDDIKERLTHLLTWIKKHRGRFKLTNQDAGSGERLNTDFVAWRGHFTKFLCTPYETREPWKMAATLYNGTIYISEVETEKAQFDRQHRSSRQREMCFWGYRFEGYLTKPLKPTTAPSTDDTTEQSNIVNTNEAYCTIVRTRLKNHSILIGAEVDCCAKDSNARPPDNYIELKTTRIMQHYKQKMNFARYKLLKFWGQSFLAGLPKIVVGMRDDDGVVKELKTYKTVDLPSVCQEFSNHWNPNICMNFLDNLLGWLKKIVTIDDKNVVYMLSFEPPFNQVNMELIDDGSECFLPNWYTNSEDEKEES